MQSILIGLQLRIEISAHFSVNFQFWADVKRSRAEPSWKSFSSSHGSLDPARLGLITSFWSHFIGLMQNNALQKCIFFFMNSYRPHFVRSWKEREKKNDTDLFLSINFLGAVIKSLKQKGTKCQLLFPHKMTLTHKIEGIQNIDQGCKCTWGNK